MAGAEGGISGPASYYREAERAARAQRALLEAILEGRVVLEPERPLFEPTTDGQSAAFRIRIDPRS